MQPAAASDVPSRQPARPWAGSLAAWLVACLAVGAVLSGCAGAPAARRIASQNANRAPVKPQAALAQVQPGISTRADLLATLGPTAMVRLDSGYEVWAYRLEADQAGGPPKGEFVVLVAPTGRVTKTRLRLAPPASAAQALAEEQEAQP